MAIDGTNGAAEVPRIAVGLADISVALGACLSEFVSIGINTRSVHTSVNQARKSAYATIAFW